MTSPRKTSIAAALLPILLAASCGGAADHESAATNPGGAIHEQTSDGDGFHGVGLSDPYVMPDVTMTDTSGEAFHLVRDTRAPVTLVFFGYTSCPDVCNLVMADVASAMTRLEPAVAEDVEMLFVTTDPARDTPEAVHDYISRFHPDFEGLTAPLPRIKSAAKPLGVAIEGTRKLPSGGYEVGHGSQVIGFTADDKARVVWTQGTPVEHLVEDIQTLRERSR